MGGVPGNIQINNRFRFSVRVAFKPVVEYCQKTTVNYIIYAHTTNYNKINNSKILIEIVYPPSFYDKQKEAVLPLDVTCKGTVEKRVRRTYTFRK